MQKNILTFFVVNDGLEISLNPHLIKKALSRNLAPNEFLPEDQLESFQKHHIAQMETLKGIAVLRISVAAVQCDAQACLS